MSFIPIPILFGCVDKGSMMHMSLRAGTQHFATWAMCPTAAQLQLSETRLQKRQPGRT